MSKRVSNKKGGDRKHKQARRRVRLGWRKKRAREIIREFKRQQELNALAEGGAA